MVLRMDAVGFEVWMGSRVVWRLGRHVSLPQVRGLRGSVLVAVVTRSRRARGICGTSRLVCCIIWRCGARGGGRGRIVGGHDCVATSIRIPDMPGCCFFLTQILSRGVSEAINNESSFGAGNAFASTRATASRRSLPMLSPPNGRRWVKHVVTTAFA